MLMQDLVAVLPELALVMTALCMLMLGAFQGQASSNTVTFVSVVALLLAGILASFDAAALFSSGEQNRSLFTGLLSYDSFAAFNRAAIFFASATALFMARPHIIRKGYQRFEIPLLFLFSALGMALMVSANDMMTLFMGIELMSLSLYVLAAMRQDDVRASEAGLKYFILGALSSGMILYGISLVYGFAGATNFDLLINNIGTFSASTLPFGLLVGLVFVISGLAFKISAVPFHMWTPDVYQGAPTPITAFFAVAPKIAAIALFLRVMMGPFGGISGQWQQIIVVISIASMTYGAISAIRQSSIKRLMAYSSIANMGFALVGLAAGSVEGSAASLTYTIIYAINSLGLFAVILMMRRGEHPLDGITAFAGLSRVRPGVAFAMTILLLSITGIPPFGGFWGKWLVFQAALAQGMVVLTVIGLLASVIAAFYYLRIIKLMYFDEAVETLDKMEEPGLRIVAWSFAIITVLLVILTDVLYGWTSVAVSIFS